MVGISKQFPGVRALKNVDLTVRKGEIHAIVGENGAGKSTLMKILCGAYQKDAGEIYLDDEKVEIRSPQDAQKLGIAIIYQEFNLASHLSAAANIYIGREPVNRTTGFVDDKSIENKAKELFDQLGVSVDVAKKVGKLTVSQQQFTEIAKALSMRPKLLIMDEPTSALPEKEIERLFTVMRRIKKEGVTVLYISHCLDEVFDIADSITVLRDGNHITTQPKNKITHENVISSIVGKEIGIMTRDRKWDNGQDAVLEVRGLCMGKTLNDISFDLHKNEILGIAGLLGSGRTELFNCIFGVEPKTSGEIFIEGERALITKPSDAIRCGIGYVPEDRKLQGLFLGLTSRSNISASNLGQLKKNGLLNNSLERELAAHYIRSLSIKVSSQEQAVLNLSGGNQQKVLLARWLALHPKILLLDDPTRGIDVGARAAIHDLIYQLAEKGLGVIFVSSELKEVMDIADRVLVLARGQITGEFSHDKVTKEKILTCATLSRAGVAKRNKMDHKE